MKWNELFEMINVEIETNGCHKSRSQRDSWIDGIFAVETAEKLKTIFEVTGGHCLCEILFNSVDDLDEDEEVPKCGKVFAEHMAFSMEDKLNDIKRHLEVFAGKTDKRAPFHALTPLLNILMEDIEAIKICLPEMKGDKTTYDIRAFNE